MKRRNLVFRILLIMSGLFFLIPIPAISQTLDSYIIVHVHNPEGVEIASIHDSTPFTSMPFQVHILDDDNFIFNGVKFLEEHNKPMKISPGSHSIKAQFNGMDLIKNIVLSPGETQVLVFEFPRTTFPIRDWAMSLENYPPGTFSRVWPVFFNPSNFPVNITEFTSWWVQGKNELGPNMSICIAGLAGLECLGFHPTLPDWGGHFYTHPVKANASYNFVLMELPENLTTDFDYSDPNIREKYRDRCRYYIQNSFSLLYMANVPFDFIGKGIKDETNQPPTPVIDYNPSFPNITSLITFDGSGSYDTDGSINSYQWDFSDGTTGQGKIVTHQFAEKGNYDIRLTVTDDTGNSNYIVRKIYVSEYIISFHDIIDQEKEVIGAVADGASKILVKITYSTSNNCPNDSDSVISEGDGTWETGWILSNNNCTRIYKAPLAYVRNNHPEDTSHGNRSIGLTITIGGQVADHNPIYLYRAPVVLIHGLWSDMNAWKGLQEKLSNQYHFPFVFSHSYPNSVWFNKNMFVPKMFAENSLNLAWNQNIVANKVDIIAHSMGGLLTKLYGSESYIRSITTVGTPHYGSNMADILWMMVDDASWNPIEKHIAFVLRLFNHPATDGAVYNLKANGGTHVDANHIKVPFITITGLSLMTEAKPSLIIEALLGNLFRFYGLVDLTASFSDIIKSVFKSERNDIIVSESSQEGGIEGSDYYVTWHCDEPGNIEIENRIIEFLNSTQYSSNLKGLSVKGPDISTNYIEDSFRQKNFKLTDLALVNITSPSDGQNYSPGEIVTVGISSTEPDNIILIATSSQHSAILNHEPYNYQFKIPENWIGPLTISAGARNVEKFIGTDSKTINVITSASLLNMKLYPNIGQFVMYQGTSTQLKILGSYSDMIERDITFLPGITTYDSSNANVVEVSESGLVTAKALGQSVITANNSGIFKNLQITVEPPPHSYIYLPLMVK